jgi:hypothetical protein
MRGGHLAGPFGIGVDNGDQLCFGVRLNHANVVGAELPRSHHGNSNGFSQLEILFARSSQTPALALKARGMIE